MIKKHSNSDSSLHEMSTKFDAVWQELPIETQTLAIEFKAFSRARQIKSVEQLLQVVLLYCGLDCSLRTTSGTFSNLGSAISDQGVAERLKGCVPWLRAVLQIMLPKVPSAVTKEMKLKIKRFLVIDGSSVQCPGARQVDYRIHLAWDWLTQSISDMQITTSKTGESLQLYEWYAGDVALADRGYSKQKDLSYVLDCQGDVIVRVAPHGLPLVDEEGKSLDLAKKLSKGSGIMSWKVLMKADKSKRVMYLHCFEIPPEKAEQIRLKKRRKAQKEGQTIKKETLIYAGWTLILTSLTPDQMTAISIGQIYRLRWQIEIVIKRLKSVLNLDKMRATRGSQLAEAYLLGKCLYILVVEKLADKIKGSKEIAWRVWQMVQEELRPLISEAASWKWTPETIKKLKERKRRRVRQHQKLLVLIL